LSGSLPNDQHVFQFPPQRLHADIVAGLMREAAAKRAWLSRVPLERNNLFS
jgi:hypothetical protein